MLNLSYKKRQYHNFSIICCFLYSLIFLCSHSAYGQTLKALSRASLAPGNNQEGLSYSYDPEIDGSGNLVVFTSTADNFTAPGAIQGELHEHIYIRDTSTGVTTQLDVTASGESGSPSGSFNPNLRTFGSSFDPHISRDGKYVVFISLSSNISPDGQGETYGAWPYLKNLETGSIQRIPFATAEDPNKSEYPAYLAINKDGSVIVIMSIISTLADESCENCTWELTVYDRNSNTTELVSTGVVGNKFNPGISDDGRFIVFENQVGDFSGPTYSYFYDREFKTTTPLNQSQLAQSPAISGDGKFIAYTDNQVQPNNIKLLNRETGQESIITQGINGEPSNGLCEFASLSQDARFVAFLSSSTNLVEKDDNDSDDIFVFDTLTQQTRLVSVQGACSGVSTTEQFNTGPPSISSDGKIIAFTVLERLIPADQKAGGQITQPADTNSFDDVYVAEVNYDDKPDIFKGNFTPTAPFITVNCSGSEVRLQLEDILSRAPARSSQANRGSSIKKITQYIFLKKNESQNGGKRNTKRLTSKKNLLTLKTLKPGSYTAQVVAEAKYKNGTAKQSRPSKAVKFNVE